MKDRVIALKAAASRSANPLEMDLLRHRMTVNNPMYRKEVVKKMVRRPNGLEKKILLWLHHHQIPLSYTGNFSVWVGPHVRGGWRNPDFANVEKRAALLAHGTYWHQDEKANQEEVDDYVSMVLRLLGDEQAHGPFNMTAPQPVTNAEFTRTLAGTLHRPAFFIAPAFILRLALGERAALMLEGQRVLPTKLSASGYQFKFPDLNSALNDVLSR